MMAERELENPTIYKCTGCGWINSVLKKKKKNNDNDNDNNNPDNAKKTR